MIVEFWRGAGRCSLIRRGSAAKPRKHEILQAVVVCDEFPSDPSSSRALLSLRYRSHEELPLLGRMERGRLTLFSARAFAEIPANEVSSSPPEAA